MLGEASNSIFLPVIIIFVCEGENLDAKYYELLIKALDAMQTHV